MPICIAGMHRSGTSLIARLLQSAGLDLGPDADMMPRQPDNPEGFWENLQFTNLNNALLELAGASWVRPPTDAGWHLDPKFDALLERAKALVKSFEGREPWGWKDPRNSLTLPFWQRLVPDVKVVICLRNPLEIAHSLRARNQVPIASGVALTTAYIRSALAAVPPERRLVTHYESYFLDFPAEVRRLVRFIGLRDTVPENAVKDEMRHNRLPLREFSKQPMSNEALAFYFDLCAEAGPTFQPSFADDLLTTFGIDADASTVNRFAAAVVDRERTIHALHERLDATVRTAQAELDVERTRGEHLQRQLLALQDQMTWRRHRWANWAAAWWHTIRKGFRR